MIHPKILIRDYGPCFCPDNEEDLKVHGNLASWSGGYVIIGDKQKRFKFLEELCEEYLNHEVIHSLLMQMRIDDENLDELRFKYQRTNKKWLFHTI